MLQPTNRLTLIDAMRPPAGFRLESAMAVTYTLNLQALVAAPAAFAIAGLGDSTKKPVGQRPVELIHALRTNAHKLTVFSEVGAIGLPPPSRAFAFLERAVVPVQAPRGGIVHPKVWVLRYEASADLDGVAEGERRLRVLITSRNLTFDTSWDIVLRLDESADSPGAELGAVGELFLGLLDNTLGAIADDHSERVRTLAEALETARFALPAGVDEIDIHVLGLDGKSSPLPTTVDRSLIISPFLTDGFFSRLGLARLDELVSRQGSLDRLGESTLKSAGKVWVLDSTLDDLIDSGPGDTLDDLKRPQHSPDDPGRPLAGLHAKAFAFEHGDRAQLFVGSANATGPAFGSNLEILAELRGPIAELGINQLCDGNGDEPGLRYLFRRYKPVDTTDGPNGCSCPPVARARRAIARLPIKGSVEKSCDGWAVTYTSAEPVPTAKDTAIHCRPLTTPGNRRPITPDTAFEERFETSLEHISAFLAFELKHDCGEETGFVVPVPLDGVPEYRDRQLLRSLIGNAERFLRYLLALLYDDSTRIEVSTLLTAIDPGDLDRGSAALLAVLEPLLRTMRRDPSRLLGMQALVTDLGADGALPDGFAELWEAIHEVTVEGTGGR